MSKTYTEEEMRRALSIGFYAGVDAGEAGIPDDFVSYNPPHMEWYCEKSIEFQNEFLRDYEFINGEIKKKIND